MNYLTKFFCALFFSLLLALSAKADNYFWLTQSEHPYGFEDVINFNHDTCAGPVRSDDIFAMMFSPIFRDRIITCADQFLQGPFYGPVFFGPATIFNADSFLWPDNATLIREWATEQNHFFAPGENYRARVVIENHALRINWAFEGTPFDTSEFEIHNLEDSSVVFFECTVQLSGILTGVLIFGSSEDIMLENNMMYSCVQNPAWPIVHSNCTDKMAIVSESKIIVMNTPVNGRNHSSGMGRPQPDQDLTSIVITAMVAALEIQFDFEDQNDVGDMYQGPIPDERGTIHLIGSLMQRHRGYQHRSNHNGTGYVRNYKYDERLRNWEFGVYNNYSVEVSPSSVEFGDVFIDSTELATIELTKLYWGVMIDSFAVPEPFFVSQIIDIPTGKEVIIGFVPVTEGNANDTLLLYMEYHTIKIPVRGSGMMTSSADDRDVNIPLSISLSAYPNPFNSSTTLSFSLPVESDVRLKILDILGRQVQTLLSEKMSAGTHLLQFDGNNLATGIYFCRLEAEEQIKIQKIILLK